MQEFLPILSTCALFSGVKSEEISAMLPCLEAQLVHYNKDAYIFRQGDQVPRLPLLLQGSLLIQHEDYWGNRSIVQALSPGEVFGEAYALPGGSCMQNDVQALESSTLMLLNVSKMLTVCATACPFHKLVTHNLFTILAEKNKKLLQKLSILAQRSTREKLLSYLSAEAQRQGNASFVIPFTRQQLADFLSVDRSAMSSELSRMQRDGIITYCKNRFTLL